MPGVIAYDWGNPPKLRGLLVAHGVAHQLLRTQPEDSHEADTWWLTAALVLPIRDMHPTSTTEVLRRVWAPDWFARPIVHAFRPGHEAVYE